METHLGAAVDLVAHVDDEGIRQPVQQRLQHLRVVHHDALGLQAVPARRKRALFAGALDDIDSLQVSAALEVSHASNKPVAVGCMSCQTLAEVQLYGRLKVQMRNQRETPMKAQCGMTATRLSAAPSMA